MNIKTLPWGKIAPVALAGVLLGAVAVSADAAEPRPMGAQATSIPNTQGAVSGWHLKDGTIYGADINPAVVKWFTGTWDNTVTTNSVKNGALGEVDLNKALTDKINDNRQAMLAASLGDAVVIAKIGGPIADNGTKLDDIDLTVPAGDYAVQVSGQIDRTTDAATPGKQTQPQLSLWLDDNNDGVFQWQDGEGSISPNAIVPDLKGRSATVNGQTLLSLDAPTHVKLIAFGYNNDAGSAGSGELTVADATVVLTPVK